MAQSAATSTRCTQSARWGGRLPASRTARLRLTLPYCSFHQIHCARERSDGGGDCGASCRGCVSSPRYQQPRRGPHRPRSKQSHLVDGGDGAAASGELHTLASLHFTSNKEMLLCAETHVASICFKRFGCFRGMLQLFQMNVAKVYQNVAYVAIVVYYVAKVYSQCFIYVF
jgi:hypothetical protein